MQWLLPLAAEFVTTVSDPAVWLSIGQGLLFGAVCLLVGIWVARTVGLLGRRAPAGETVGVGLASGLMVLAAFWAAIWSGGRSSFTPVAIGFALAIALAIARRFRRSAPEPSGSASSSREGDSTSARFRPRKSLVLACLAGGVFVVAVALLYGSTMAPSPRDGVQRVEHTDPAFYAVLGRDLATTGTEASYTPAGFTDIPGLPAQTWYHWGELWLASAVITVMGATPLAARFFIVLPVVLLAAAALTGTLVRRLATTKSRQAYVFGFLACLFLAPIPLPGPYFSSWAVGLIFGITLYGLAAVAVLLSLYCVTVVGSSRPSWALAGFIGNSAAFILPAHLAIALLTFVGIGSVLAIRIVQRWLATVPLPIVSPGLRPVFIVMGAAIVATVSWGLLTGHGLGESGFPPTVLPFSRPWLDIVILTGLGSGTLLLIPVAWFVARKEAPIQAALYVGTMALLVAGAVAWGALFGLVTMFHLLFGGIAVFAAPAGAVGVRMIFQRLRERGHVRVAAGLVIVTVIQLELGVAAGIVRLQSFGPHDLINPPIPLSVLGAIRKLPAEAKLAYACRPLEEPGFADPILVSIDAHTNHRVVPMCFEADFLSTFLGAPRSLVGPNQSFKWAPQRALYPDPTADPSSAEVAAFMKEHGIDYIFANRTHPNSLVDGTIPIATSQDTQLLRIP